MKNGNLDTLNEKQAINLLVEVLKCRDYNTYLHSLKVASISFKIARVFDPLNSTQYYYAGLLHDIGKIGMPDNILKGDRKITSADREEIKLHVSRGVNILKKSNVSSLVEQATRTHHERIDGSGYPSGLKGKEIPLCGRILAIADTFSALTGNRLYQNTSTTSEALGILREESHLFDKTILSWFLGSNIPFERDTVYSKDLISHRSF